MEDKEQKIVGLWALDKDGLEALEIAWALKQKELGRNLTGDELHCLMRELAEKQEVRRLTEGVGNPAEIKQALKDNFNVKEIPQGGNQDDKETEETEKT